MAIKLGYTTVDGTENRLPKAPTNIQVLRVGTFYDERYGKFEITKEHLASMKKNFDARVRAGEIALDYAHESNKEAAAWFKSLELSDDGNELWATVKWTPPGETTILNEIYRYVYADFMFDYQDNETLQKYGPTLLGAGLTNRPVVKGMEPILELSESLGKGNTMDPKDQKIADLEKQLGEMKDKMCASEKEAGDMKKKLAEYESANQKMAEEKKLAEKTTKFNTMLTEGKVVEAQREAYIQGDSEKFMDLAQPVKLSEQGHGQDKTKTDDKNKDAEAQVMELAEKAVTEKRAKDLSSGIKVVLSENPELRKQYEAKFN